MRLILAALLLLTTAAGAWGHDDDAMIDPPPQVIQVPHTAKMSEVIPLLAEVAPEAKLAWAVIPTPEGLTFILAVSTPDGVQIVSHTVAVKRPPPGEDPPEDGPPVNEQVVKAWLDEVPTDARGATVTDPIAGTTASRQQAVGRTFREIGAVTHRLGSIRATNVMLATGLAASYGNGADEWAPFDAAARKALGQMAADGATATEYGVVLTLIGEVLQ